MNSVCPVPSAATFVIAAVVCVFSLIITWRSVRYVFRRAEARKLPGVASHTDRSETIRVLPPPVAPGVTDAETEPHVLGATGEAQRRIADYATLIAEIASTARRRVDEARMPVHILLTTQFGELNENQEEMLGTADSALMSLEEELTRLATIADIDRGALSVPRSCVDVAEVLRTLSPMLQAQATKEGVRLTFDLEPALPRVLGHLPRLRDALRLALTDDIRYAVPGSTVTVKSLSAPSAVSVVVRGSHHSYAGNILLAARLLDIQGGSLEHQDGTTVITMPREIVVLTDPRPLQPNGAMR